MSSEAWARASSFDTALNQARVRASVLHYPGFLCSCGKSFSNIIDFRNHWANDIRPEYFKLLKQKEEEREEARREKIRQHKILEEKEASEKLELRRELDKRDLIE